MIKKNKIKRSKRFNILTNSLFSVPLPSPRVFLSLLSPFSIPFLSLSPHTHIDDCDSIKKKGEESLLCFSFSF